MASTYDYWDDERKRYVCGQCYSSGDEDAEIAKLGAERDEAQSRSDEKGDIIAEQAKGIGMLGSKLDEVREQLAAARAALDGERERALTEAADWFEADGAVVQHKAKDGTVTTFDVAFRVAEILRRRAAEAKGGKRPLKISVIEHHGYTEHENNVYAEFARLRKELNDARDERDAARAALDGERELHDETQRALNLGIEFAFDASDGRPGIDTACEVIAKYDALRAAEAITVPPNRTGTREESQAIADWHHDEINRRAAEAKSTTYPFPVESSPSVPPGTIVAMRDGKVVGAITDVAAEAKQLPCPDCKGSGVRVKYHGGSLTDPNVIGLAMESSPCWCQAAEANGEPK